MSILYPHADNIVIGTMTRKFIDELLNGGYIRALQCISNPSGARYVSFARDYAASYDAPIGAALLFGPKGGAYMELVHFITAEKLRDYIDLESHPTLDYLNKPKRPGMLLRESSTGQ